LVSHYINKAEFTKNKVARFKLSWYLPESGDIKDAFLNLDFSLGYEEDALDYKAWAIKGTPFWTCISTWAMKDKLERSVTDNVGDVDDINDIDNIDEIGDVDIDELGQNPSPERRHLKKKSQRSHSLKKRSKMKVSNVSKTKKGRILHLPFEFKLFKLKFEVK
ncbi:15345_t:CDS:2, partial [Funneliformis geosporum]